MPNCYNCGHAEDEHEWFRARPCLYDDCDCQEYEETLETEDSGEE